MDLGTLAAFWALSILFVLTPGADWSFAISAGINNRALPAVIGLLTGHVLATALVAVGVGALVASVPPALTVLTVVGASYLVWLGIGLLRRPGTVSAGELVEGSNRSWLLRGVGVSGLNPKVILLFLALLPQFIIVGAILPVGVQVATLGLVHVLNCALVYFVVAWGARRILAGRPRAARWVSRISGAVMIMLGIFLVIERLVTR